MEDRDIKSMLEKSRLPSLGVEMTAKREAATETEMVRDIGKEMLVRGSVPLAPTEKTVDKAEADIRKGMVSQAETAIEPLLVTETARTAARERPKGVGRQETMEIGKGKSAVPTEMSTRMAQQQIPKRISQNGQPVQRPRLAQRRMAGGGLPQAMAKKGMSKALKWALIAGGSTATATGGILSIINLFT